MENKKTTQKGMEEVKQLANSYFELIKIKSTKKTAKVSARASIGVLYIILILMCLSFLGISLAYFISELVESIPLGFLITGGLPLLILFLLKIFKVSTHRFLLNFFTRIITHE